MKLKLNLVMVILVIILSVLYFSNQNFCLIEDKEFNNVNYWLLYGQNQHINNGYLILSVNDTNRLWSYSKAQRGIMPHGWTRKDTLGKEIEFRRNIEANSGYIFLRVVANRSNFQFYDENESWVNFGVALWFKLDDNYDDPDSTQLVVDIRFASMKENQFYVKDIPFKGSHVDNDYHYLVTSNPYMANSSRFYDITVDVGSIVKKAFKYWNIQKAILKNVDVYIEANYGCGKVWVDYVDLYVKPQPNSPYVILNSGLCGFITFFVMLFLNILFGKLKQRGQMRGLRER